MRKNQINGIINDIIHLGEDFNPLGRISLKNKLILNLVTGEISYVKEDDVSKFYREKYRWFQDRIKKLGGNMGDFKSAKIYVSKNEERVKVIYKKTSFEKKCNYCEASFMIKKIKDKIKKLKPVADVSNVVN